MAKLSYNPRGNKTMKFNLKKDSLVNLSDDAEVISRDMTPQIGGGHDDCETDHCNETRTCQYTGKTGCIDQCEMY